MWRRALEFAIHMSDQFPAGSRFAAIAFAAEAEVRFSFRESVGAAGNATLLRELFVLQKPHSGASDLAEALRLLQNTLLNPNDLVGTGFRGFEVPTVVILLVNGLSTSPSATISAADQLNRFAGLQRFVGAVGPVPIGAYGAELSRVAGSSNNVMGAENYNQLESFVLVRAC